MTRLILLLATGLLLTASAHGEVLQTVRWLVPDFPPFHIVDGPDRNTGLRDRYLPELWQHLPRFRHVRELSSGERAWALMKAGAPVCTLSMLKTPERERVMLFSRQPFQRQLPPRLIVDAKLAGQLRADTASRDDVDLGRAVAPGMLSLGINPRRHFGEPLDATLEAAKRQAPYQVQEFTDGSYLSGLLRVMAAGRINAVLGYSVELSYLARGNVDLLGLDVLPLSNATSLVPSYVACSRHPLGERVIADLDAQDLNDAAARRLRDDYSSLLSPAERKRYEMALARAH